MTELNGSTASLILNGNSGITIMSEIHHYFSNEYWNDAIERLSYISLEEWDGEFLISEHNLNGIHNEIVMKGTIISLEMILLVIQCIKNSSKKVQKSLFRFRNMSDERTKSSPGKCIFIKWLSYAIHRIEDRIDRVEVDGIVDPRELQVEMMIVEEIMELICSFSVIKKDRQLDVIKHKYGVDWFFIVHQVSSIHHLKLQYYYEHIYI